MATQNLITSTPTDPDAPSFLNLPAEIRNRIYESLLKEHGTMQLEHFDDSRVALVRRSADDNANYNAMIDSGQEPPRPHVRHQEGLQMLRVCRQVHHEAASMLYADAFLHAQRDGCCDITGFFLNSAVAKWLRQIGQHSRFVRSLDIDLAVVVSARCGCIGSEPQATFRESGEYIHCMALVDALWAADAVMTISFVDSGPISTYCSVGPHHNLVAVKSACDPKGLQKTIQSLGQDRLGLKQIRKIIGDIGITPDGSAGIIVFWTKDWQLRQRAEEPCWIRDSQVSFLQDAMTFQAAEDNTLQITHGDLPSKSNNLLDLPEILLGMVFSHVLTANAKYEINLESATDFRTLCGILYVNHPLYRSYFVEFLQESTFNISIVTPSIRTDLQHSKLRRLLETEVGWFKRGSLTELDTFGQGVECCIDIHVQLNTPLLTSTPKDKVNATALIAATIEAQDACIINIYTHDGDDTTRSYTTSIQRLRRQTMKVLGKF